MHVCSETDIATLPCLRRIELGTISWVDSGQIVSSGLHGGVSNVDKMDTIRARANSVLWSGDIIIVKRTSPPQRPDLLLHHCSPRRAPGTMREVGQIPRLFNDEHVVSKTRLGWE